MTPEERDRLTKVEAKLEGQEAWLRAIAADVSEIKEAAHMGRGAWVFILRLGAVVAALAAAAAWIFDHLPRK